MLLALSLLLLLVLLLVAAVVGAMRVWSPPVSARDFAAMSGVCLGGRHAMTSWAARLCSGLATMGPVGDGDGL